MLQNIFASDSIAAVPSAVFCIPFIALNQPLQFRSGSGMVRTYGVGEAVDEIIKAREFMDVTV